jgi:uncharacterized protein (DUF2252 family)
MSESPAAQTSGATAPASPKQVARTPEAVPHLTPTERVARGKAARAEVPRSSHGAWEPAPNRPDPIALLEEQAVTRVPELLPIRYGRMANSPFAFYRGAAYVMASDLAATPRSGLTVQACGDAHLSNFGVYGSPERNLVFDINDFDETHPGPWEWDVKRLAASLEIAARGNGFADKERRAIVLTTVARYRQAMQTFAAMRNLDLWYAHLGMDEFMAQAGSLVDPKRLKVVERNLAKARTRDSLHAYEKLTSLVDGEPRIVSQPPLIVPIDELVPDMERDQFVTEVRGMLRDYRRTIETDRRHLLENFRFVDMARKVVGVGSVGTRAWIILMLGRDEQDPLFIQAKEAGASVLESFLGKSEYANHGQRVVAGQRLMQASSDIFLGWQRVTGLDGIQRDFYLRQLRDWKGSAEVEAMVPQGMTVYGQMCAWTLARAHARSGDRIAIGAYLGNGDVFDKAIAEFASRYADQNERDHQGLVEAVGSGRITAEVGV